MTAGLGDMKTRQGRERVGKGGIWKWSKDWRRSINEFGTYVILDIMCSISLPTKRTERPSKKEKRKSFGS